jgi:branched-chain amino acid aminotransferase
MNQVKYVILNGEFMPANSPVLMAGNRGFLYGDALTELMHANGTKIQFPDEHFASIRRGMETLKMDHLRNFTADMLRYQSGRLLNKNRLYKGVAVRLTVFRDALGMFIPESNNISYLLQAAPVPNELYELNEQGYTVDVYPEHRKNCDAFSHLKTTSNLFYVMAGIYQRNNNLDESIVLNDRGNVCEGLSSNIFIVKNNTLLTPSLHEGCIGGVIRSQLVKLAPSAGLSVTESAIIKPDDLLHADELFFTNAISGIRWAVAFRRIRFFNKTARQLTSLLNEAAFG